MHKLVKPLPHDTPTAIELSPGNSIRVTLIDANHCVGAVMFLIEGNGKAILYTGDIRAETVWINALVQNPVLLPYTMGVLRLDCMYLDTTFATKSKPYQEFPTKAEGIRELLHKVQHYPEDTIFYFHAWTFGYEAVWVALSTFLGTRIHLDAYRARLYGSLSNLDKRQLRAVGLDVESENKFLRECGLEIREAPALCGFRNGNSIQPGCLTSRESVRIHSCERGMGCRVMDQDTDNKVVHIIPIITRSGSTEIAELGAGGGKGDLDQKEELETIDVASITKFMELCANTIKDEDRLQKVLANLKLGLAEQIASVDLDMQLQNATGNSNEELSLQSIISVLSANVANSREESRLTNETIRFPYSRHSSYSELCEMLALLKPRDVYPCTVDEDNWTPELSMSNLFGHHCPEIDFRHDTEMMVLYEVRVAREKVKREHEVSQQHDTQTTDEQTLSSPAMAKHAELRTSDPPAQNDESTQEQHFATPSEPPDGTNNRSISLDNDVATASSTIFPPTSSLLSESSSHLARKRRKVTNKHLAYEAAIGSQFTWHDYGGLESTRRREDKEEQEL